ncbi:cation-efflux pump [bacterium]|jgi:cation diffusion facilitator family transporter|nr:cation-efflux pump [bacterium]
MNSSEERFRKSKIASWIGIWASFFLTLFKIFAGISGRSQAMLSDGFHSLSDIFANLLALTSVKISEKPVDKEHPYGHGKAEAIAALSISFLLFGISIVLAYRALNALFLKIKIVPGLLPLVAALVSISVNEAMFRYTYYIGKKFENLAVLASSYDHRADALSSIPALIGIAGARFGYTFLDPLAGFAVTLFIFGMGIKILRPSLRELMDTSLPEDFIEEIRKVTLSVERVRRIDDIKTRRMGWRNSIDLSVEIDAHLSIEEGHEISNQIEKLLLQKLKNIGNLMIHINPGTERREEENRKLETIARILQQHYQKFVNFHDLSIVRKGNEEQVYLHLAMAKKISVAEAHRVCDHLERDIKRELPNFKVLIHVEPT